MLFIHSIVLSVITSFIGMFLLIDGTSIWTRSLTFLTIFLGSMATISLCEIFKRNNHEKIPQNFIADIFLNYGIHICSVVFPLISNLMIAMLSGTMGMYSMMLGESGISRVIELVWVIPSVVFGITFTLAAYPKDSIEIINKIEEKLKKTKENAKPSLVSTTEKKYCKNCSTEIDSNTKFCPNCGREILK
ncbi:MAG: zinc ribbon domain-containing protein [Fusobacterium varium]|uniref:zinc ribbon domain-containing protein n=1 Tax=Fusobacterium varium TaxID=856 RepID=UPI003994E719